MMEHGQVILMSFLGVVAAAMIGGEILNSERFGNKNGPKNGPKTVPVRNVLMWIGLIGVLALSAWEAKHGNFSFLF